MTRKVFKDVKVECPFIEDRRYICVEYHEVSMNMSLAHHYKKMGFECADYDQCNLLDNYGHCSCYDRLPHRPPTD